MQKFNSCIDEFRARPELPVGGADVIFGKDLAGRQSWPVTADETSKQS